MPVTCEGSSSVEAGCQVINARLFQATESAARFLFSSQDLMGNAITGTGTIYYREVGSTVWLTETQAAASTSYNILVPGLASGTLYEWYAEVELPDGSTCVSSINQFMTEGGVINPPTDCTVCIENGAGMWQVELEDAYNGWIEQPANANTQGPWYSWQGGNNFFLAEAGEDILKYTVDIKQAGNYIFKIHSLADNAGQGSAIDQSNDIWVRFPTGVDVAGEVQAQQDWIKVFRNGSLANQWTWVSAAEKNATQWAQTVQFLAAGTHCIELSGRSNGHGIDRIALCLQGNNVNPANLPDSPLTNCGGSKELPASSLYDPSTDIIALHYDVAPDLDDLDAIASGCSLSNCFGIDPCVVIGAYGLNDPQRAVQYNDPNSSKLGQSNATYANVSRRQMAIDVATAAYGAGNFLDTGGGNWDAAVNAQAAKWKPVVQSGGLVHVAEGGPSDFTADVLRRLLVLGCTAAQIKSSVQVVQHAPPFNNGNTLPANLAYMQANATYIGIDNGNQSGNSTADLEDASENTTTGAFAVWARASACGNAWDAAMDRYVTKIDFSDTVEYLHILGIGLGTISDVTDFCNYVE